MLQIEKSLRLPTFAEDAPIVLGNGEAFHFRPPRIVMYPRWDDDGKMLMDATLNHGQEWLDRYEIVRTELDARHGDNFTEHMMFFADRMLICNYKESIRYHYPKLLGYTSREPRCRAMVEQIWELVIGRDPKGITSDGASLP